MPKLVPIPVPFTQISTRRVQIALDLFWDAARQWAQQHGYQKQQGAYQGLPPC